MNEKTEDPKNRKEAQRWLILAALAFLTSSVLFALGEHGSLIEGLSNYPNPFNSKMENTSIIYQLPQDLPVRMRIYDLFGFQVREYNFGPGEMGGRLGDNSIQWDGTDESGQKVAKGGYICQVTVEGDRPARGLRKIGVIH